MKKSAGIFLVFLLTGLAIFSFFIDSKVRKESPPSNLSVYESKEIPRIDPEPSALGSKEDPIARQEYELAMIKDPATGEVPNNIRRREYLFSAQLPKKNQRYDFRNAETQSSLWRPIGPYNIGGRTRALAIDITDEDIILAGGVSGGMWRTEDGGKNWTKTTVPSSIHSVSCIVQDTRPGKTHIWYYGTGEFTSNSASKKNAPYRGDGVFKSVDGGKTWHQLISTAEGVPNNYNSQFQYVSRLIVNPFNENEDEIFLATVGAIFRSVDGGDNWDLVLGTKLLSTPNTDLNSANISDYTDIAQTGDGAYYAVFSQISRSATSPNRGVYRSTDGIKWYEITPGSWPRRYARTVIAPSKNNSNDIFFSVNADFEMLWKYTYVSGDGLQTQGIWQNLTENIPAYGGDVGDYDSQSSYNMVLEVHPENDDIVFLGGTNLYRSTDGFSTNLNTGWIGGYDTANDISIYPNHFVDQHALAFFPSNPNRMISANDGGIFITEDNTKDHPTWLPLNNGFITTQFYSVGIDEFGALGHVMGGLQDNGTLITNKPVDLNSWNNLLTGDGGYSAITRNSSFYYASYQYGKIYRLTLNNNLQIQSFARIDPAGSGGSDRLLFVNPYVLAPENQNIIYFSGGNLIWRNLNASQIPLFKNEAATTNWEILQNSEISDGLISAINASYNPYGNLYYGTSRGDLYRIKNANHSNYTIENISASIFPTDGYISCIAIDRKNSKNIAVAFSNYNVISLFYSEDEGNNFENISGNLEQNPDGSGSGPSVRWVEIVSKNDAPAMYYVGTSTGVYSTSELQGVNTIWEQEGPEEIGNVLVPMIKYFSEDGHVVVATHGNGMYTSRIENVWQTEIAYDREGFSFDNPYPNPFSNEVFIPFTIPDDGLVRARIYNSLGQQIKTLLWTNQFKGENVITWDGTNDGGTKVNRGTYFCRLEFAGDAIGTRILYVP